jgi:alanine racemase
MKFTSFSAIFLKVSQWASKNRIMACLSFGLGVFYPVGGTSDKKEPARVSLVPPARSWYTLPEIATAQEDKAKIMADKRELGNFTTWIELDRRAFFNNYNFFAQRVGRTTKICAVVKANAYGHGLLEMAGLALEAGAACLSVHSVDEALRIRASHPSVDILILGPVPPPRMEEALRGNAQLAVYDEGTLKHLEEVRRRVGGICRVHLKTETGTNRQGIRIQDLPSFLGLLKTTPEIHLEGIYTHFANIEDTTNHEYARFQMDNFRKCVEAVEGAGFSPPVQHMACSAATLLFPETHVDMVRLGISLYGLWPSRETYICYVLQWGNSRSDRLLPVLSWKARPCQIKDLGEDSYIGYGCAYKTTHPSRIAVIPVGYADGYDRHLSNDGHVLIHGRRAPVRGRICMNFFMVDVTDIPGVYTEDEAVLLGKQGDEQIAAGDLAERIGTIHYEVVTRLHPAIPRIIV